MLPSAQALWASTAGAAAEVSLPEEEDDEDGADVPADWVASPKLPLDDAVAPAVAVAVPEVVEPSEPPPDASVLVALDCCDSAETEAVSPLVVAVVKVVGVAAFSPLLLLVVAPEPDAAVEEGMTVKKVDVALTSWQSRS